MKMKSIMTCLIIPACVAVVGLGAQLHQSNGVRASMNFCPFMQDHNHSDGVNKRGDQAMGFDHLKTTHHFLLNKDGGIIQVEANDPKDHTSRDQIRMHLQHVAQMFGMGNFDIPMFVHDQEVPGTKQMKELKDWISYRYAETSNG